MTQGQRDRISVTISELRDIHPPTKRTDRCIKRLLETLELAEPDPDREFCGYTSGGDPIYADMVPARRDHDQDVERFDGLS